MIASFLVIFAAVAVCQALLTVTYADCLSPPSTNPTAPEATRNVDGAKLA